MRFPLVMFSAARTWVRWRSASTHEWPSRRRPPSSRRLGAATLALALACSFGWASALAFAAPGCRPDRVRPRPQASPGETGQAEAAGATASTSSAASTTAARVGAAASTTAAGTD